MINKPEMQLKNEYSLPSENNYNFMTDYKGANDKKILIGRTGSNIWGTGGNTQVKILPKQKKLLKPDFYKNSTDPIK